MAFRRVLPLSSRRGVVWLARRAPGRALSGAAGDAGDAGDWTEHRAESGHPYWYNATTEESVWERPAALAHEVDDVASSMAHAVEKQRVLPFSVGEGVDKGGVRIYVGSWNRVLKALKVFSLSSCALGVIGGPALVVLGNPSTSLAQRVALAGGLATLSLATTGVLHICTKPYVHELWATPLRVLTDGPAAASESGDALDLVVTAKKLSLFGGLYPTSFLLAALGPNADHAFASHQVDDEAASSFFINIEDDEGWGQGEDVGTVTPVEVQTLLRSRAQI